MAEKIQLSMTDTPRGYQKAKLTYPCSSWTPSLLIRSQDNRKAAIEDLPAYRNLHSLGQLEKVIWAEKKGKRSLGGL